MATKKKKPTLTARITKLEKRFTSALDGAPLSQHLDQINVELGGLHRGVREVERRLEGTAQVDPSATLALRLSRLEARDSVTFAEMKEIVTTVTDEMHKGDQAIIEGLGGVKWKTQEGHIRWIGLLTTPHLENIIQGSFGSGKLRTLVQAELRRRATDRRYRESKAETREQDVSECKAKTADLERIMRGSWGGEGTRAYIADVLSYRKDVRKWRKSMLLGRPGGERIDQGYAACDASKHERDTAKINARTCPAATALGLTNEKDLAEQIETTRAWASVALDRSIAAGKLPFRERVYLAWHMLRGK